ncbi:MAG: acireductone synthase [Gammaproteobacteria bacterium]|nr:acireductone synthase [Gammaproteobacteria bacterium]MCP5137527.1 acireductone synthase [Gammaproteobacteria bacterium]
MPVRAVLTDIEGTTTSISFVYDVLFPYARAHLAAFVREHAEQPEIALELDAVRAELGDTSLDNESVIEVLLGWAKEDRKITPLKSLQGQIWRDGYANGGFTGHVYPDAVAALRRWHAVGCALYVYSSGSVAAQKLLFRYSDAGDLTPLFSGYFDTKTGGKREMISYQTIAASIGLEASDILFLSDIAEELDAARQAGMQTAWLVRDRVVDPDSRHPQYVDFTGIECG